MRDRSGRTNVNQETSAVVQASDANSLTNGQKLLTFKYVLKIALEVLADGYCEEKNEKNRNFLIYRHQNKVTKI